MTRHGMKSILRGLAALLLAAAPLAAQTAAAPEPETDEAAALFEAARRAQFPGGKPQKITSLEARLDFVIKDPAEKTGQAVGSTVQIVSVFEGRFALESQMSRDGRKTVDHIIDYDDKCWQIVDGKRTPLRRNSKTKKDVEKLKSRKRQMTRLFKMFFLDRLEVKPGSLEIVERDVKLEFKIGYKKFEFDTDRLRLVDGDGTVIDTWIDRESKDVVKARIGGDAEDADEFQLARFATVPVGDGTGEGVRIPHGTCFNENGEPRLVLTGNKGDIRVNSLAEKRRIALFAPREKD